MESLWEPASPENDLSPLESLARPDLSALLWRLPDTKAGESQDIELAASTAEWLSRLPRHGPYIIVGADPSKPRFDIKSCWERARKAAGIKDATLHDLRRTVIDLVRQRRGIFLASQIGRHSDIKVTAEHYRPDATGERREALEKVVLPFVRRKAG